MGNLHDSEIFLKKCKDFKFFVAIVESDYEKELSVRLKESYILLSLNKFKITQIPSVYDIFNFIDSRKNYFESSERQFFLLIVRVGVHETPIIYDQRALLQEITNIFSLYFGKYFKIRYYAVLDKNPEELIEIPKDIYDMEICKNLTVNIDVLTNLRRNQYNILQKGLRLFNLSLIIKYIDISLAYSLLISCIETYAQKYSDEKESFEELDIYERIRKLLIPKLQKYFFIHEIYQFLNEIGEKIVKTMFSGITAKFCDFISKNINTQYNNKYLNSMLRNIYSRRSKFLHGGVIFPSYHPKKLGFFNDYTKAGNLKERHGHIVVNRVPPFLWFANRVKEVIIKFIRYLETNKASENDIKRYNKVDDVDENELQLSLKKEKLPKSAMEAIMIDDYERDEDYFDLLNE